MKDLTRSASVPGGCVNVLFHCISGKTRPLDFRSPKASRPDLGALLPCLRCLALPTHAGCASTCLWCCFALPRVPRRLPSRSWGFPGCLSSCPGCLAPWVSRPALGATPCFGCHALLWVSRPLVHWVSRPALGVKPCFGCVLPLVLHWVQRPALGVSLASPCPSRLALLWVQRPALGATPCFGCHALLWVSRSLVHWVSCPALGVRPCFGCVLGCRRPAFTLLDFPGCLSSCPGCLAPWVPRFGCNALPGVARSALGVSPSRALGVTACFGCLALLRVAPCAQVPLVLHWGATLCFGCLSCFALPKSPRPAWVQRPCFGCHALLWVSRPAFGVSPSRALGVMPCFVGHALLWVCPRVPCLSSCIGCFALLWVSRALGPRLPCAPRPAWGASPCLGFLAPPGCFDLPGWPLPALGVGWLGPDRLQSSCVARVLSQGDASPPTCDISVPPSMHFGGPLHESAHSL